MPSATERARELPPGPELDALFFETCWGWYVKSAGIYEHVVDQDGCHRLSYPKVTADAAACDSWVMRWANEQGDLIWRVSNYNACIYRGDDFDLLAEEDGVDWKHALTRAAIAAAEQMEKRDGN